MAAKIFRINYKSDFILTLHSDAGWMTPFCIKFWTGAPSLAYFVGWDGTTYTHCTYDPSEPTELVVQFDDHHLPIGELKYQVAYHFTVADFPDNTEDEVINPGNITTEIDGETYQVMLDFTGETAPEIQFALPAYANEAQRIANEQQRIEDEQTRINNEERRISNEQTRLDNEAQRIRNEQTRISQEEARVREFATLKNESQEATTAANNAAALANQKAQLAADKAQLAADKAALAQDAATLANEKAQLAANKAELANNAAQLANDKAALAQQKAEYAQEQGSYAKAQGDYAKQEGDAAQDMLSQIAVFDVSIYNAFEGVLATYASLTAALAAVPSEFQIAGLTLKFVNSHSGEYLQYRLTSSIWSVIESDWQGVDDEPTPDSANLVKSGGVSKYLPKKDTLIEDPESTDGYIMKTNGTTEANESYSIVVPIILDGCSEVILNEGEPVYCGANIAVLFECDSNGDYIRTLRQRGDYTPNERNRYVVSFANNTNVAMYIGFCTYTTEKNYIVRNNAKAASEEETEEKFGEIDARIETVEDVVYKADGTKIGSHTAYVDGNLKTGWISYDDGAFHNSPTNYANSYCIRNVFFKKIKCNVDNGSKDEAAIAFYSDKNIVSANYIKASSVKATVKGTAEYEADIPDNCQFIYVTCTNQIEDPVIELMFEDEYISFSNIEQKEIKDSVLEINGRLGSNRHLSYSTSYTSYKSVEETGRLYAKFITLDDASTRTHYIFGSNSNNFFILFKQTDGKLQVKFSGTSGNRVTIDAVKIKKGSLYEIEFEWNNGSYTLTVNGVEYTGTYEDSISSVTIGFGDCKYHTNSIYALVDSFAIDSFSDFNSSYLEASASKAQEILNSLYESQFDQLYEDIGGIDIEKIEYIDGRLSKTFNNPFLTKRAYYHYNPAGFIKDKDGHNIIPSESVADIRVASRLGFQFIESNVVLSSDGVAYSLHPNGNYFGTEVISLDGTDISEIRPDSLTSEYIDTYVRYNSYLDKYKTKLPRVEEFIIACKEYNMGILLQSDLGDVFTLARKYLDDSKIICYRPRTSASNHIRKVQKFFGFCLNWHSSSSDTVASIIASADLVGPPLLIGVGPGTLGAWTNDEFDDLVEQAHAKGYLVATGYIRGTQLQDLIRKGLDVYASSYNVNEFEQNYEYFDMDNDMSNIQTSGAFANGVITLSANDTIECGSTDDIHLGKAFLHMNFSGKVNITFGSQGYGQNDNRKNIISDGSTDYFESDYIFDNITKLTITAVEATTINMLVYKTSKC